MDGARRHRPAVIYEPRRRARAARASFQRRFESPRPHQAGPNCQYRVGEGPLRRHRVVRVRPVVHVHTASVAQHSRVARQMDLTG